MIHTIYAIAVDGMDRIFVQTHEPTTLQREAIRHAHRVIKIEVDLPDVVKVDRVIRVQASEETSEQFLQRAFR